MYYQRKQNKYGAIKQTYQGYSYMSKKEAAKAMELDMLVKAGEIKGWERQKKIELKGENGGHVCNYYIDFVVEHKDGVIEFIEVKGFKTDVWKLKWKLFEDKYGSDCNYKLSIEY